MRKVGIVTWYWGNYGSILQAYALQQTVESLGYDCDVIKHHVTENRRKQIKYRVKHNGVLNTIRYYFSQGISKLAGHKDKERNKRISTLDAFVNKKLKLSEKKYDNSDYKQCNGYDIYISGSDQVWNPDHTFLSEFYWLNFAEPTSKRIAYAPSIGNPRLFDEDKAKIKKYLGAFAAVSVREALGTDILNGILGEDRVITMTDPTMLVPADEWEAVLPEKTVNSPYMFAYILRDTSEQRKYIKEIAKSMGLRLMVYPSLEQSTGAECWGDVNIFDDDPFDFLNRIREADVVITDSFHCSVFSLLFHKCFYVVKKAGRESSQFLRLEHLLSSCGVINRVIDIHSTITKDMYDCDKVDSAIAVEREKGLRFLREALEA